MSEYRELFSDEAEHALLGAMLLDGELFDAITSQISAADFHDPENAALFQTMIGCHAAGIPVDPVTLHDFAEYLPSGTRTMAYAGELARNTPSTANWKAYAKVVTERAVLRRLVDAADTVRELATENRPVAEIIASAQQAMADLRDLQTGEPDYKRMDEVVTRNIDIIDSKFNGTLQSGLSTGLVDLDKLIRGLRKKTVTIVAGLPGSGKTRSACRSRSTSRAAEPALAWCSRWRCRRRSWAIARWHPSVVSTCENSMTDSCRTMIGLG